MADLTVKQLDEFEAGFGGSMKFVRDGLGVKSFGMQVLEMPANADQYPEHDHSHDGQEEVYTVLDGQATLQAGGETVQLTPGTFVRVGASEKRKIVTGDQGCRLLALGAIPGSVYEIPEFSKPAATA